MKRLWLGIGILAVLMGLGITATVGMAKVCDPLCVTLNEAANAVQEGQWEQAVRLSDAARTRWEHFRSVSATVTNHEPMEEVDALFRALQIFARQRDGIRFAESCARLAALADAIGEAQAIWWWNVL